MVEDAQIEVAAKLATGAWCIWNNRNEIRAGGVRKEGSVLMRGGNIALE